MPNRPHRREEIHAGEDTVAQIGLGRRTQPGDRSGSGQPNGLLGGHMGRMDQAPSFVHRHRVEQPFDRAASCEAQAVLDLALLFRDVNMDRAAGRRRRDDRVHFIRCRRPQRMEGAAEHHPLVGAGTGQIRQEVEIGLDCMEKAPLAGLRRLAAEIGMSIEHRQQCQADAGAPRRRQDPLGHFGPIGIGLPIDAVMQIVEFRDGAEAAFHQLDEELGGDRLDILGRELADGAIHLLPPGPEAVIAAAAHLGQTGHGALESVGMQIGQGWDRRSAQDLGVLRRRSGPDIGDQAAPVDVYGDAGYPAARQ